MASGTAAGSLTEQQRTAVCRRGASVVLSSGAGCGKTHVLTERYLSHLRDDGAEVAQVVAITFTDRAARQMRNRIRQAVTRKLKETHDDVQRWERHLRGLETAQISTIHAFCGTLLRQHAVEAGLDPRFDVLEEVLSVNLEAEALTGSLQRLLTAESAAGNDLQELVLLYGWRPIVEAVQHLLRAHDAPAWQQWLARPPDEVAADWQQYASAVLLPRYLDYLMAATPKIARCLTLLKRTPPKAGSKMAENARYLLEQTACLAQSPDLGSAIEGLIEAAKVGGERAKAWPSEEIYEEAKTALEGFRSALKDQRLASFASADEGLPDAVAVGQRFLRVAGEVAEAYRALKREHGVVDFQDLLVLARNLLRDRPEVRTRLQNRFRFLLIDELQDTDPVQMELVEHLCGQELRTGKLFAVGDHKQSIYRFRGAEVRLFQELRRTVPDEGRLELTLNFRSQPAILDFTNALLSHRLDDYEPLQAHHPQTNPDPCVEFLWSPRGDKEGVQEGRSREAHWIARRIAAMVGQETLVVERAKAPTLRLVRAGDVVLLFRAMSNVHLYEEALREQGLDYYLVGGRAFFAQQEIYDLLNLLRALENPQDAVALAGTLRSPFCCLSDEALFLLSRHPEGMWTGLHDETVRARLPEDQRATADRACRFLDRWRGLKDRLPIARLLQEVFADSGYDAATQFEFLGDRKLANLWKLVDLARTFDRSGLFGLAEFIQRLGDLVGSQAREEQAATQPENADVVRLMSIHQAKGLEFPVVFVPDFAATGGGSHRPVAHWDARLGCVVRPPADEEELPFPDAGFRLWQAAEAVEDWREDLRTLYVACTRAQDYLVLSAALKQPYSPDTTWTLTLAERFDLQTGACLADGFPAVHVPRVKVVSNLDVLPPSRRQPDRREPHTAGLTAEAGVAADRLPAEVAAVPCRLAGKRIFTVAELETYLRQTDGSLSDAADLPPEDFAYQFHAEDGSDRNAWLRPRDCLERVDRPDQGALGRVLRSVLREWDFRVPEHWRPLLERAVQAEARAQDPTALVEEGERWLSRFAASETVRELAAAVTCYRDVEFLLYGPAQDGRPANGNAPAIRGILDCLWRDAPGAWHLLKLVAEPVGTETKTSERQADELGLALAMHAVRQQTGAWPESITLCSLADGSVRRQGGRHYRRPELLAAVADALTDLARRHLSPGTRIAASAAPAH